MLITLLTLISGIISGLVLGVIGAGSGLIATPFLIYVLNVPIHNAISISLTASAVMTGCYLIKVLKYRLIKWKYALIITITGIVFTPVGSKAAFLFSQKSLTILFSFLMIFGSYFIWRRTKTEFLEFHIPHASVKYTNLVLILTGASSGFMSGVSGIGGSIIIMPVLLLIINLNMRIAAATTIFAAMVFSTSSALSHMLMNRSIDWKVGSLFILGGIVGVLIGFAISLKTEDLKLKKRFATIFGTIGIIMLIHTFIS